MRLIDGNCFDYLQSIECDIVFTSPLYNRKRNDKCKQYYDIALERIDRGV